MEETAAKMSRELEKTAMKSSIPTKKVKLKENYKTIIKTVIYLIQKHFSSQNIVIANINQVRHCSQGQYQNTLKENTYIWSYILKHNIIKHISYMHHNIIYNILLEK